jgi:hypothetical protein
VIAAAKMLKPLTLSAALLSAATAGFAGAPAGQFGVQINLTSAGSCTGSSSQVSLQVSCTTNVIAAMVPGPFMPGFRPGLDLLPDYCRNELARDNQVARVTCQLIDSGLLANGRDPEGQGWQIEDRLYASNQDDAPAEQQACLRIFYTRSALTELPLFSARGRPQWPEMLVSF